MSILLPEPDLKAIIDEIDQNIERMIIILQEELKKLNDSFDRYLHRIAKHDTSLDAALSEKLKEAKLVFEGAKVEVSAITELLEQLQHIKQVNKMVRFALLDSEGQVFVKISSYIGAIANICLGQLKYIRNRYEAILKKIKEEMTRLWMDRELSIALRLILSVNQLQLNKYLTAFQRAEVLYADVSLAIMSAKDEDFHQRIVLRMVSNRLPSDEERKIINTLFPSWGSDKN